MHLLFRPVRCTRHYELQSSITDICQLELCYSETLCQTSSLRQGQGHNGNDLGWVGTSYLYLNFDDPRLLVLISGYPRFLTAVFCITSGSQGQGHGGNDLGWVGARHLCLNFGDPRLLVLISSYPRFLT